MACLSPNDSWSLTNSFLLDFPQVLHRFLTPFSLVSHNFLTGFSQLSHRFHRAFSQASHWFLKDLLGRLLIDWFLKILQGFSQTVTGFPQIPHSFRTGSSQLPSQTQGNRIPLVKHFSQNPLAAVSLISHRKNNSRWVPTIPLQPRFENKCHKSGQTWLFHLSTRGVVCDYFFVILNHHRIR